VLAAVLATPFSAAATGTFLLTAALGSIIHADYVQRHRRIRLPMRAVRPRPSDTRFPFRAEANRLAA
jgi:hypothetical protein